MDEETTHRWVAGPESADSAARSLSRANLRRRRTWVVLLVLWLACGAPVAAVLDTDSTVSRLAWAYGLVTVMGVVALPVGLFIGRRATRRRFARRIGPGVELTARFGSSSLELAGPLSRHELTYAGLEHVQRVGDWVHLRQTASPVLIVWPGELFPDPELEQMQAAVAARR